MILNSLRLSYLDNPWKHRTQTDRNDSVAVDAKEPDREGDQVLAFVKSMSSTPAMKLPMVYRKIHEICEAKGLEIMRNLVGQYITSLDMEGSPSPCSKWTTG